MVNDTGTTYEAAPTVSYILTLIAGVLVVLNGLLLILSGTTLAIPISGGEMWFGTGGIAVGLVMLFAAMQLDVHPAHHVRWGAVIIITSTVSLALVGGGFLMGFILGLVGGIIAIAWKL